MVAYGSYTEKTEDIVLDAGCISLLNSFTSLYAGVAVFAMLGHKANKDGSSVADVVQSGEGLAFVAIPDGLSELPAAGLWCFIFFAMLFALALDSSIAMLESWTTMLRVRSAWKSPGDIARGFCEPPRHRAGALTETTSRR